MVNNIATTSTVQVYNYATYDDTWSFSNSVSQVMSVTGTPGYTWVSLSWVPPAGGLNLQNNECGYVVCRSLTAPPTTLSDSGAQIVYVGTGTFFGDRPLTQNTADLLTADMGLLPNTTYYYSVFIVTTIPAGQTSGSYSAPISVAVTTLPWSEGSSVPTNLVLDSNFQKDVNKPGSNWVATNPGKNFTFKVVTDDPDAAKDVMNPNITDYLRVTTGPGQATAPTAVISQTIKLSENLVPGTLYSFTFWYRTDNPINIADYNGTKQPYTPNIGINGGSVPLLASLPNDVFQATQSIDNEDNVGNTSETQTTYCSWADLKNANRSLVYNPQGPVNYNYNTPNISGFWVQGGFTFLIGSPDVSPVRNAYNYNAKTGGGDSVQSPTPTMEPVPNLGDTLTITIQVLGTQKGEQYINPNIFANIEKTLI